MLAIFHAALDVFINRPTGQDVVPNVMGAAVVGAALIFARRFGKTHFSPLAKVIQTN